MVFRDARAQNAMIRSKKNLREPLRHVLNEDGQKSERFPGSVGKLLQLNGKLAFLCIDNSLNRVAAEEVTELVNFYHNSVPGRKADKINWFLEFSGVSFRYVPGS